MIDLHTHILPGIDDGAADLNASISLLRIEQKQGVETVALTPHFYRDKERPEGFLVKRDAAWNRLRNELPREPFPNLILGAEVAWFPGLAECPELEEFCYKDTKILLIEPPFTPWNGEFFRQLYNLVIRRGVTPMISHLDRYVSCQKKQHIDQLLDLGFPIQVSAGAVLHRTFRNWALRMLKNHEALLISDCHNLDTRLPNIGDAMALLEKKLGHQIALRIASATDEALLE